MSNFLKTLKVSSFIVLFLFSLQSLAQKLNDAYTPDTRLYECLSKDYLQKLSTEKSELILYYNYYLDHSFYVVDLKREKAVTGTDIHTVAYSKESGKSGLFIEKSYNAQTFNVLKYNFTRNLDGFTTYVWKEAGLALVFYPVRHFQANFNNYLKNDIEN